jgi:hypothetical protein
MFDKWLNLQRTGECARVFLTLPPFGRITGIRFIGYNLSPLFYGTPCLLDDAKVNSESQSGKLFIGFIFDSLKISAVVF